MKYIAGNLSLLQTDRTILSDFCFRRRAGVIRFSYKNWSRFRRSTQSSGQFFRFTPVLNVPRPGANSCGRKQILFRFIFRLQPAVDSLAQNWHDGCRGPPRIRMNWTWTQSYVCFARLKNTLWAEKRLFMNLHIL